VKKWEACKEQLKNETGNLDLSPYIDAARSICNPPPKNGPDRICLSLVPIVNVPFEDLSVLQDDMEIDVRKKSFKLNTAEINNPTGEKFLGKVSEASPIPEVLRLSLKHWYSDNFEIMKYVNGVGVFFRWCYPANATSNAEVRSKLAQQQQHPLATMMLNGGFAFFENATAVRPFAAFAVVHGFDLDFLGPQQAILDGYLDSSMSNRMAWQDVTIPQIVETGADQFVWIPPKMEGLRSIDSGGFAYYVNRGKIGQEKYPIFRLQPVDGLPPNEQKAGWMSLGWGRK